MAAGRLGRLARAGLALALALLGAGSEGEVTLQGRVQPVELGSGSAISVVTEWWIALRASALRIGQATWPLV